MLRQNESRSFLWKNLIDPCVPWRQIRQKMMAIAGIIPVAKWQSWTAIRWRLQIMQKGMRKTRFEICWSRNMSTSIGVSAKKWQELSQLPITSSGDICMPACKLHRHQRVSSGWLHLIKRVVWSRCGSCNNLSKYAAKNRWRKRQQKLKTQLESFW